LRAFYTIRCVKERINSVLKSFRKYRPLKRSSITGKIIIGIIGTHIGTGATHFAVMLSNYMSECLGMKTAYIECFPQKELGYMEKLYYLDGNATSMTESFSIYKVHYYKNIREDRIAKIMGYEYECVILDLGLDVNKMRNEFLRCDKKIVISNLAPWKLNELETFITSKGLEREVCNLEYGISFPVNRVIKEVSKLYGISCFTIPYEPDPFNLSNDTIKMFQKII